MRNFIRSLWGPKLLVIAIIVGGLAIVLWRWIAPGGPESLAIVEPQQLSVLGRQGKALFAANCAQCHGEIGGGTDTGPPLVHTIYNPGHHADYAFLMAVRNGVRAHHWRFGNMPPQRHVSDAQVSAIVQYVRELQQANGIGYQPHQM